MAIRDRQRFLSQLQASTLEIYCIADCVFMCLCYLLCLQYRKQERICVLGLAGKSDTLFDVKLMEVVNDEVGLFLF